MNVPEITNMINAVFEEHFDIVTINPEMRSKVQGFRQLFIAEVSYDPVYSEERFGALCDKILAEHKEFVGRTDTWPGSDDVQKLRCLVKQTKILSLCCRLSGLYSEDFYARYAAEKWTDEEWKRQDAVICGLENVCEELHFKICKFIRRVESYRSAEEWLLRLIDLVCNGSNEK